MHACAYCELNMIFTIQINHHLSGNGRYKAFKCSKSQRDTQDLQDLDARLEYAALLHKHSNSLTSAMEYNAPAESTSIDNGSQCQYWNSHILGSADCTNPTSSVLTQSVYSVNQQIVRPAYAERCTCYRQPYSPICDITV